MKFNAKVLALAAVNPCFWGASAFMAKAPKPLAFTAGHSRQVSSAPSPFVLYSDIALDKYTPEQDIGAGLPTDEDLIFAENMETLEPVRVQGGALRTWSFQGVERLLVGITADDLTLMSGDKKMFIEGRLLHCKVDLCQGPDNTPLRMVVRSGKGKLRPFKAVIENPGGDSTLFIRNVGDVEFPVVASVGGANEDGSAGLMAVSERIYEMRDPKELQGGAIITYPLDASVSSAKVILHTDGRPLHALVELVQGPNAVKHTIDLYTEDGMLRPLFTVIDTPGAGNVIRIVNTAPLEFPLSVHVEPYIVEA